MIPLTAYASNSVDLLAPLFERTASGEHHFQR